MDYYQGVVFEYLRAKRSIFLNTECCLQLNEGNPDTCGPHWYCDAVAIELTKKAGAVYLCEISYAKKLGALLGRLRSWQEHWPELLTALRRDSHVREDWPVRPWLFIPVQEVDAARVELENLCRPVKADGMPLPKLTTLESVVPWRYQSWNRTEDVAQPDSVPESMR